MAREELASLSSIARGAAIERFDDALHEVLKNISDANTPAQKAREITLKMKLTPTESRKSMACRLEVQTKLAGPCPTITTLYVQAKNGVLSAFEFDPEQPSLLELNADLDRIAKKN